MKLTYCPRTGIHTAEYRGHIASARSVATAIRLCWESAFPAVLGNRGKVLQLVRP